MRVFVTGASGFVGSAVVRELVGAGHQVVGLARSEEAAAAVKAAGAEVHRGALDDLDGLRAGAAASDGVIHTAFIHDFADFEACVQADRRAIETLGEALAGSGRPLIVTSATGLVGEGRVGTEADLPDSTILTAGRGAAEGLALAFAERGVRVSVLRLPGSVHGEGDHGFVPAAIAIARAKGVSGYPGDGSQRWPAVHLLDAARLYRVALESAPAGTRLNAVGEEGVPVKAIAEVVGRHLKLPVAAIPEAEQAAHFGWLGDFLARDFPASSAVTRQRFGWEPTGPGLLADLEAGHYFGE